MSVGSVLRIAAELQNLAQIRHFVAERGKALGATLDAIEDMILAVDESAANIVLHGYGGQDGEIEVAVRREGDALVVCLRDEAAPFDPRNVPPPDLSLPLEERPLGKLGVFLVNQLVDQVKHTARPQGGNELTLIIQAAIREPDPGKP